VPLFAYRCVYCEKPCDVLVRSYEKPDLRCPDAGCRGHGDTGALTLDGLGLGSRPASPHFKGEGWAKDGYASRKT